MHIYIYLNKKQYKKYRNIVRKLNTTDGKLMKALALLLLQNPDQLTPQLKTILSSSKEQPHPHSKSSTPCQKAPKSSAYSATDH